MHLYSNPCWLLLLPAMALLWWRFRKRQPAPCIRFPDIPQVTIDRHPLLQLPQLDLYGAVTCGILALCAPYAERMVTGQSEEYGRRIYIAFDISPSMARESEAPLPELPDHWLRKYSPPVQQGEGFRKKMAIEVARRAAARFIFARLQRHQADEIGWMDFDAVARLRLPLDGNLEQALMIAMFPVAGTTPDNFGEGTNFGDKPGGPIDAAAALFAQVEKETRVKTSNILVLVTDGVEKLEPAVQERLADVLRKGRIRPYLIGIGDAFGNKDLAIANVCEAAGGKVYRVEDGALEKCFQDIDNTEGGKIPTSTRFDRQELFYVPLIIALLCAVSWWLRESVLFGR